MHVLSYQPCWLGNTGHGSFSIIPSLLGLWYFFLHEFIAQQRNSCSCLSRSSFWRYCPDV